MLFLNNKRGLNAIWLAFLLLNVSFGQIDFDPVGDVEITISQVPSTVAPEGSGTIEVLIALPKYTHITSREYDFFFVEPEEIAGVDWAPPSFPVGTEYHGEEVYQGNVKVIVPFSTTDAFNKGDEITFPILIGYQICVEVEPEYCTPPIEREFQGIIRIGDGDSSVIVDAEKRTLEQRAMSALESGSLIALLWVFLGGVALSFTPCVYPVIPITIAYIGGRTGGNRVRGLILSLVFVLGLALVYSVLGIFAAATGGVFGLSGQNPWVMGFVTLVFLIMGTGMLGAFDIALPSSLQSRMTSHKRSGFLGALLVGGTTGLVAAPCVGPVLIALLSWISISGNLWAGFIYMFVFACGLGAIFVVIGTFAGTLTTLPKAGEWMDRVKQIFGIILIVAAFYFGKGLISDVWFTLLVGLGFILLSAILGIFNKLPDNAGLGSKFGRSIAVFVMVTGIFYTLLGFAKMHNINTMGGVVVSGGMIANDRIVESKATVKWIKDDEMRAFEMAKNEGKLVMIDFWAEWCAACKELDHKSFSQPQLYNYINEHFIPLKIDGTKITDDIKEIWERYSVLGLPTVLFISPDGKELGRFEAFRSAEQILSIIENIPH